MMAMPAKARKSTKYRWPRPSRYSSTTRYCCWQMPNIASERAATMLPAKRTKDGFCTSPLRCGTAEKKYSLFQPETCTRRSERYMNKPLKQLPKFASEAEERAFWETNDSADYVDWTKAKRGVLPNLKPSTKTISLRLPQHMLDSIKAAANSRDVPYQSLIKVWLQEKLHSH